MTPPDPDATGPDPTSPDPARPDTARPGGTGAEPSGTDAGAARGPELPADIDAAFASIVADWAADGAPRWPDEESGSPARPDAPRDAGPSSGLGTATPPGGQRTPPAVPGRQAPRPGSSPHVDPPVPDARRTPPARPTEDEHYVPPDPPPLPRLGLSSLLGLALLIVGVVLLAVPGLLGGPVGLGIVPGLLAMTAGLGWLVFGLRGGRDTGDGSDDGAVL
jgi:hypothetical protein